MPDWVIQIIGFAGTGIAAYTAIRADLAALHIKADHAKESADEAHRRIDQFNQHCRN